MSEKLQFTLIINQNSVFMEAMRISATRLWWEDNAAEYRVLNNKWGDDGKKVPISDYTRDTMRNIVINKSIELGVSSTLRDVWHKAGKQTEHDENQMVLPFDDI